MSAGACAWTGEAVFESPATATSASTARIIRFISLSSELVREVVLERELHLEPIALDPLPGRELHPEDVAFPELEVRADVPSPAGGVAGKVEGVGENVVPVDPAQDSSRAHVAPLAGVLVRSREIGYREPRTDVLEL